MALDETLNQGKIAEACICYTGDILDDSRTKYNLDYLSLIHIWVSDVSPRVS